MAVMRNRKVLTKWDDLIQDANRQIEMARERIATLKLTIKGLERIRDSGMPWPGRGAAEDSAR